MESFHLFRGLPLGLPPSDLQSHLLLATLPRSILSKYPHHISLPTSTLLIIGIIPIPSLILSFLTVPLGLSDHTSQYIHYSSLYFPSLSCCHTPCFRPIQK